MAGILEAIRDCRAVFVARIGDGPKVSAVLDPLSPALSGGRGSLWDSSVLKY